MRSNFSSSNLQQTDENFTFLNKRETDRTFYTFIMCIEFVKNQGNQLIRVRVRCYVNLFFFELDSHGARDASTKRTRR